ncbi:MAG: class I SAM-dependent methyltransferase [Victivallales bacterium]|nr:class I SAM-dependent methyltransferase [Victivallales bacterium]
MIEIKLKPGKEKSLLHRHPWVYSGALAAPLPDLPGGATVKLVSAAGRFLGYGAWSPASQIRLRIWSFATDEIPEGDFFARRLDAAVARREHLGLAESGNACRLVYGECDGMPGLIVDRYADFLVCQFLSAGAERHRDDIVAALAERLHPTGIYERSDTAARAKEGLPERCGLLYGAEPPERIAIREEQLTFDVDVRKGHKTGFYLDQRDSRHTVAAACNGKEVLNCFSYTGAFSAWALAGNARHVTDIDASAYALETAMANYRRNGFAPERCEQLCGDVFQLLRKFRDAARSFDVIILDPPKFAENRGQLPRAARAYKDINLLACKLLRPGGRLFTFSCSGAMTAELFQKVVADAALDAGRNAAVVRRLGQAADHATALNFPEGFYLKGLECIVE